MLRMLKLAPCKTIDNGKILIESISLVREITRVGDCTYILDVFVVRMIQGENDELSKKYSYLLDIDV